MKRPESESPVALVSGGSSGIGFAIARLLQQRGYRICLLARDQDRLRDAQRRLQQSGSTSVSIASLDVTNAELCESAVAGILGEWGRIDWLVTSAGIVEPGMFLELPIEAHRRQMEVNYFGTLNLVRPVAAAMRRQGSGKMTMISSGAAFLGIAGYSGYSPSKFAVRALAETLRVELAADGIRVGVAFPPDTDTPQLAEEQASKPEATKRITAGGGVLSAEDVARAIVKGALAGRFMLTPGLLMSLYGWVYSIWAPFFRMRQAHIMRVVERERQSSPEQRKSD